MKSRPLVSVNIPSKNSAQTIGDTLASVKKQTYPTIETIVCDGYSRDQSVEISKSFGARTYYAKGISDARYLGYRKSRGKYILVLDSDQVLERGLVSACVRLCDEKGFDVVTIREKSIIRKGTVIERLIAYDKWVIDATRDTDVVFGTALPRFFRRSVLTGAKWPKHLIVFDHTILYNELLKRGAKHSYLRHPSINHFEVTSWWKFCKKFFRYGEGYIEALRELPATIAVHALPRRSYFSTAALSRPHYFLGLLLLYSVKAISAGLGILSYFLGKAVGK